MKFWINFLFIFSLSAGEIIFNEPCTGEPFLTQSFQGKVNIGQITIHTLDKNNIIYNGNDSLIVSILGTPYGMDATEIISKKKMKIYGWCFSVNGQTPESTPNLMEAEENEVVNWFYGVSLFDQQEWVEYCTPVYLDPPPWLCH